MPRYARRLAALTVWLVSVAALVACHDGGAKTLLLDTGLNGDWRASTTLVSSTCPIEFSADLAPGPSTYRIEQNGSNLALLTKSCCGDIPWGTGTLDGSTVTIQTQRLPIDQGPACTLFLVDSITGLVDRDRIAGETSLSVTPSGTCEPAFPCEVRGTFTLDRGAADPKILCYASIVPCF